MKRIKRLAKTGNVCIKLVLSGIYRKYNIFIIVLNYPIFI